MPMIVPSLPWKDLAQEHPRRLRQWFPPWRHRQRHRQWRGGRRTHPRLNRRTAASHTSIVTKLPRGKGNTHLMARPAITPCWQRQASYIACCCSQIRHNSLTGIANYCVYGMPVGGGEVTGCKRPRCNLNSCYECDRIRS